MALVRPRLEDLRDPLLERDYVRLCTRPAFFRNRALAALGLGALLLLLYGLRDADAPTDVLGRSLHLVFTWVAAVLAGTMAAAESAVAIPTERATGSLTILLTVPRRAMRLAAGFFLSRVLVALTAVLAILPLEGTALLLGGVDGSTLATSLLLVVTMAVYGAAAGLFAGYDAANHRLAVGRAGLLTMSLTLLLPLVLMVSGLIFQESAPERTLNVLHPASPADWCFAAAAVVFLVSPLGALFVHTFEVARTGVPFGWFAMTGPGKYLLVAGLAVAGAILSVVVTGLRLRADLERSAVPSRRGSFRSWLARFVGHRSAEADHGPPREAKRVWDRPLLWRESRPPRSALVRWMLRLCILAYGGLLAWLWFGPTFKTMTQWGSHETPFFDIMAAIPLWLFLLAVLKNCGSLFAEERERNALDLLRASPIPAREYFLARFLGLGLRFLPLAAVTAPFAVIGFFLGHDHVLGILGWGIGGALVVPFFALLMFRAGMRAPTARAAHRRTAMATGVFLVVWPLLGWLLQATFSPSDRFQAAFYAANPFVAMTTPYVLLWDVVSEHTWKGRDATDLWFVRTGCFAAAFWFAVAACLWYRLPRDLDRALHDAEEA